ncbi:hypothetical protein [Pontibacter akesuensis]|uniref:Uncharacterized protein n=1 Tax=Pontibacter akesuensis TaxID=388950 RepID=A0A1I7H2W7_9BACT|nr:hypothetical protein [Pontibacter akesuensis]GHA53747.1 hypothetical protein GCM10007389_01220 [Pontibacter akesuensis]SFU55038.1 hypothetical protein SAMN04487941_1458 [Pontibacter akesuensis]
MQSRRTFRIVMTIACFFFAGLNAYRIWTGEYESLDVFILVVFLVFGSIYLFILFRKDKPQ